LTESSVVKLKDFVGTYFDTLRPDQFLFVYNEVFDLLARNTTVIPSDEIPVSVFKTPASDESVFIVPPGNSLTGVSFTTVLYDGLGEQIDVGPLSTWRPYLSSIPSIPPIIPLLDRVERANDFPQVSVASAVSGVVAVDVNEGYFGVSDSVAYGLYTLNPTGLPNIAKPYLSELLQQLDVPSSQMLSSLLQSIEINSTNITAAITASTVALEAATAASTTSINAAIAASTLALEASNALSTASLEAAITAASVANGAAIAASTAAIVAAIAAGGGGGGGCDPAPIISAIEYNAEVISDAVSFNAVNTETVLRQALMYRPPKRVYKNVNQVPTLETYEDLSLAELLYRAAFSTQSIAGSIDEDTYTGVPYLSSLIPNMGGPTTPAIGPTDAPILIQEFPVPHPGVLATDVFGSYGELKPGIDPFTAGRFSSNFLPGEFVVSTSASAASIIGGSGLATGSGGSRSRDELQAEFRARLERIGVKPPHG
jgi:hypothetical protein